VKTINFSVHSKECNYTISIGNGLLSQVAELFDTQRYSSIFIITDKNVQPFWLDKLRSALSQRCDYVVLDPGEQAKNISNIACIWEAMHNAGCDRKTLVLTLGGGVVGDMGGFAASTYMRGIAFGHIPTTTLAQVDSSIGGKTGIDFNGVKNLVGTFSQPIGVLIDTTTLATLPRREFLAGFAEMVKHALIRDDSYLKALTRKSPLDFTAAELSDLIATSNGIKVKVAQDDETESGERKILNFGHTIGHAIESLSLKTKQPLLHGEAVSIGMVIEAQLSQFKGYLSPKEVQQIKDVLQKVGLPVEVPDLPIEQILSMLHTDKKNEKGTVNYSLLKSIGNAIYNQTVSEQIVSQVLTRHMTNAGNVTSIIV